MGFLGALAFGTTATLKPIEGLQIHAVERIEEAIEAARGL